MPFQVLGGLRCLFDGLKGRVDSRWVSFLASKAGRGTAHEGQVEGPQAGGRCGISGEIGSGRSSGAKARVHIAALNVRAEARTLKAETRTLKAQTRTLHRGSLLAVEPIRRLLDDIPGRTPSNPQETP